MSSIQYGRWAIVFWIFRYWLKTSNSYKCAKTLYVNGAFVCKIRKNRDGSLLKMVTLQDFSRRVNQLFYKKNHIEICVTPGGVFNNLWIHGYWCICISVGLIAGDRKIKRKLFNCGMFIWKCSIWRTVKSYYRSKSRTNTFFYPLLVATGRKKGTFLIKK